jgi:hypothetical protein
VVFVGGSLVDQGGHNILEPAVHGKPIMFGPHMENFAEIADAFLKNQGAVQVQSATDLASVVVRLVGIRWSGPALAPPPGRWWKPTVAPNHGRWTRSPRFCRRPVRVVWCARSGADVPGYFRRQYRHGRSGQDAAGGPDCRLLIEAGERPAILSRGYGRRRRDDGVTIVSDGTHILADIDRAGDEPLLLARSLPGAAVLVCEQRRCGRGARGISAEGHRQCVG